MTSLGRRFLVALTGITAVVVLLAALVVWLVARQVLHTAGDPGLQGWARVAQRFAERDASPSPSPSPPRPLGEPTRNDSRRMALVTDAATGTPLLRMGEIPDSVVAALSRPASSVERLWTLDARDGLMRVLAVPLPRAPRGGPFQPVVADAVSADIPTGPAVLYLFHDLGPVQEELRRLAWGLINLWLVATGLAFAVGWRLRATMLRPLQRLGEAIHALGPDDLTARLSLASGPVEARTVMERLNGLLDRQEQAFRREQATIANIAHELRTPVAGLRTAIEFRLRTPTGLASEDRELLGDCLTTVQRMQDMVGNLLLLARLEAGREPLPLAAVDLVTLVRHAGERWRAAAAQRGGQLRIELPAIAVAHSSADHLAIILDNLLGNAVAHGSGDLVVALRGTAGRWELRVENPFTGTVDAKLLGTAFYRADAARRDGAHAGLGLMLCRRIATLLGADWSVTADAGRFVVQVGLAGDPSAPRR